MAHLVTYLRLLDADADGAAWQEVARIVLSQDVEKDGERAKRVWASHLARAKWMTKEGYGICYAAEHHTERFRANRAQAGEAGGASARGLTDGLYSRGV